MLTAHPTTTTGVSSPGTTGSATVVVTLNYRLGLLGSLSASGVWINESHPFGNYGILTSRRRSAG